MRIIKTGICVFICLLIEYYTSPEVGLISSVAAIVCLGSTLQATASNSLRSLVGAFIGGIAGIAFIPLATNIEVEWLYVILMPIGLMAVIYLCTAIGMPEAASTCAFAYVAVLIVPYSNGDQSPFTVAVSYIFDTSLGILVAIFVNRFIAPPKKRKPQDVHIEADRFAYITSQLKDRLTGLEELMIFDTKLIDGPQSKAPSWYFPTEIPMDLRHESVRLPVPAEFQKQNYISGVYVTSGYAVVPFFIRQQDGYASLPVIRRPATVSWHAVPVEKETYGVLAPKQLYGPETLRPATHVFRSLMRRVPAAPRMDEGQGGSQRTKGKSTSKAKAQGAKNAKAKAPQGTKNAKGAKGKPSSKANASRESKNAKGSKGKPSSKVNASQQTGSSRDADGANAPGNPEASQGSKSAKAQDRASSTKSTSGRSSRPREANAPKRRR